MKRREFLTAASVAGGAVAASGFAGAEAETPTSSPTGTATSSGGNATATGTAGGGGKNFTWTVEMTDANKYVPATLKVRPGDTVVWKNVGSVAHSVTAYQDKLPEGADYWASGGFDSESAARDGWSNGKGQIKGGESYEHTFQTKGTHEYYCIPHETLGMKGTIEVTPDAPTPTPAPSGGGGHRKVDPEHMGVPFQAHFVGLATALMVVVSLVYTFFVLKYGESPNTKGGND